MDQRTTSPKRQKSCMATSAATTTTATTNHPPLAPQERPENKESSSTKPSHRTCEACQQTLPVHLFPKEKFAKKNKQNNQTNNKIVCRQCRKNQTAERCKQPTKSQIKLGRKSDSGAVRRPNNFGYCDYVDRLFSMDCFPDIVSLRAFTSAKDVSESMAAIQAACQHGHLSKHNRKKRPEKIMCLCIGDGSTPRTAVLACFLQKWTRVVSIDPALHEEWRGAEPKGVRGLAGFGGTLEEFLARCEQRRDGGDVDDSFGGSRTNFDHLLLLCVHSHARLTGSASVPNIMAKYDNVPTCTLVSLPCCPKFRSQKDVGRVPDVRYEDDCVFSACRRVEVWNFEHTVQCCMEVSKENINA